MVYSLPVLKSLKYFVEICRLGILASETTGQSRILLNSDSPLLLGTDGPSHQHTCLGKFWNLVTRAVSGLENLTRVDPPSPSPPGPSSLLLSGACSFWAGDPYLCHWKIFNTKNINIRPPLCPRGMQSLWAWKAFHMNAKFDRKSSPGLPGSRIFKDSGGMW